MIPMKVKFFASLREYVGHDQLDVQWHSGDTVAELIDRLQEEYELCAKMFREKNVLCALNQSVVPVSTEVGEQDELAFFPPVTGG